MTPVAVRLYYPRHARQFAYPLMIKFCQTVLFLCVFPLFCINAVAETADLTTEYTRQLKLLDGLRTYNAQQGKMIAEQQKDITDLNDSLAGVSSVQRQITPLIERMIDNLDTFVELDVPFSLGKRKEMTANLHALLYRSDVTVAEKFRVVLLAYQTEISYGSTMEVYSDLVAVEGTDVQVDILKVGRIALIFQTPDLKHTGVWDADNRTWVLLGDDYVDNISQAIDLVRKEKTDAFVRLPLVVQKPR